ncbi:MAG: glycosyltransferase, partial [Bacteroidetes bacterium]
FTEAGIDPKKFTVLNIGVPTERFSHIQPDYQSKRSTHFLAVGRLVEKKSPINLLKAFLKCARENSDVILDVVGDGELMPAVKQFLEEEPLIKDKVRLHGFLSQDDLIPLYRQTHIFVQHSITGSDGNKEGWPVGIAEACSCSLPVISTNHAGIPEQVIDGETGFLVAENDFESMGKRMLELSQDWQLAKSMGKKAKEHIFNHGDLNNQIGKLKNLLESVTKTSLV